MMDVPPLPAFEFDVQNRAGFSATAAGLPLIRGSSFQFYEPDWSRSYYSSTFNDQVVSKKPNGDLTVAFKSRDGRAEGTHDYEKIENGVRVRYRFKWNGSQPVHVELSSGYLWAKPLSAGSLRVDGVRILSLSSSSYPNATEIGPRSYGAGKEFAFEGPLGTLRVVGSGAPFTIFDARGYAQPWATGRDIYWLGAQSMPIQPGGTLEAALEVTFTPSMGARRSESRSMAASPLPAALSATARAVPLLPKPKLITYAEDKPFLIPTDVLSVDATSTYEGMARELLSGLRRFHDLEQTRFALRGDARIIYRVQNLNLPSEGYEIRVGSDLVTVIGQDAAGLRAANHTLAQLAENRNSKLVWPVCTIRDWPSVNWRGIHLFGGPEIRTFHKRLADRILVPLKINRVVLQCERTKWKAQPKIWTPLFNDREDLRATFEMYRSKGIEPIPLIQSLGHMEWFFGNGANRELAVNPEIPYTLDPRKPEALKAIEAIWEEAVTLLRPKAMHFGLDEIDMRGMPDDPNFTTEIWQKMTPTLGAIAQRNQAVAIFWGDKGLAPGQAIDAALGDDPVNAKKRRDALPRGAWIADWHYKNDPSPDRFMNSLNLWKSEGFWPIASGWFNPSNIRGLSEAAYRSSAGYLQTTWAGYEHTEDSMLREFRQVAAYVLAADYAWSGRAENPEKLDYDPAAVFARLYYEDPAPLAPKEGDSLGQGSPFQIGAVKFRRLDGMNLASLLEPGGSGQPSEITLSTEGLEGKTLALAVKTAQVCEEHDPVAEIILETSDGQKISRTLRYGADVRAASDTRPTYRGQGAQGWRLTRLYLDEKAKITKLTMRSSNAYAGLQIGGVTAY